MAKPYLAGAGTLKALVNVFLIVIMATIRRRVLLLNGKCAGSRPCVTLGLFQRVAEYASFRFICGTNRKSGSPKGLKGEYKKNKTENVCIKKKNKKRNRRLIMFFFFLGIY